MLRFVARGVCDVTMMLEAMALSMARMMMEALAMEARMMMMEMAMAMASEL